jgi:hypothetical protein
MRAFGPATGRRLACFVRQASLAIVDAQGESSVASRSRALEEIFR